MRDNFLRLRLIALFLIGALVTGILVFKADRLDTIYRSGEVTEKEIGSEFGIP